VRRRRQDFRARCRHRVMLAERRLQGWEFDPGMRCYRKSNRMVTDAEIDVYGWAGATRRHQA
jgi:hypothetical protein